MDVGLRPPWLSVVVPVWDDAQALAQTLASFNALPDVGEREMIIADASTGGVLCEGPATVRRVACARPNRGAQMNAGAALARGEWLLFHHADTEFTPAHLTALDAARTDPALLGGAFHRKFDERHPRLRWLENFNRILSDHLGGTIYGDQSFFVRRAHFATLGGFADYPLMEDVEFSRRLRKAGGVRLLDPPIATSARRSRHRGAWRTSVQNGLFLLLFKLGASPHSLHRWYYRGKNANAGKDD